MVKRRTGGAAAGSAGTSTGSSASTSGSTGSTSASTSGSTGSTSASTSGSTGSTSASSGSGSISSTSGRRDYGQSPSVSRYIDYNIRVIEEKKRQESLKPPTIQKSVSTLSTTPSMPSQVTTDTTPTAPVISGELSRLIIESQSNYPEAWAKATGTTNTDKQYEQVTGTSPIQPITAQLQDIEEIAQEEERIKQIEQAPIYQRLDDQIQNIINDINAGVVQVPDWFRNNIEWVQNGHITQQEFLTAYNYLVDQQIVHAPETPLIVPPVLETITADMIRQRLDYFTIQNGRAKGQITFTLNDNFNSFYYNKDISNLVQFQTKNKIDFLIKENRLRFTATERTQTIQYDEDMLGNLIVDIESFVWLGTAQPTPFSPVLRMEIREGKSASATKTGLMGAGVAGGIGILILLGFIIDGVGKKKK